VNIIAHPKVLDSRNLSNPEFFNLKDYNQIILVKDVPNGEEYLSLIHPQRYINKIKRACAVRAKLAEVQLAPEDFEIACLAVGTVILASKQNDFAIQRLTGHHACREKAMGFNLFNSMAIAAQRVVDQGKRVAIIDFDGHHGNGTQNIFYNSNQVLCCSVHQQGSFPLTGKSSEQGKGEGKGFTFNIPIPPGSDDQVFLSALERIVARVIEFQPDQVGICAGFDGYCADKLLKLKYTLKGFYEAGRMIGTNFGSTFALLGGGYHRDVGQCLAAFLKGINQEKYPHNSS
jgi:acetoin utilization deacetylase AcuC-like enzyme